MGYINMVEHAIPPFLLGDVAEPLPGTERAAGRSRGLVGSKVAKDMGLPLLDVVEGVVTVQDVKQTDVCMMILTSRTG
jgi:hypothetical protein